MRIVSYHKLVLYVMLKGEPNCFKVRNMERIFRLDSMNLDISIVIKIIRRLNQLVDLIHHFTKRLLDDAGADDRARVAFARLIDNPPRRDT